MIAVDSSVLIDLLGDDPRADAAEASLRLALTAGPVVLCDVVLSEVTAGLGRGSDVMDALEDMGLRFVSLDQRAAIRAGTELQALAFQTEESKAYMSRFRRDGETVSALLSERDSAYSDYRERDK